MLPDVKYLWLYLGVYFGTIIFHMCWHYVLRYWFEKIRAKPYFTEKKEKDKLRYLEKWNSNWSHVLLMIIILINYQYEDCSFFKDDICFMKAKPSLIALDMIYLGYMTENYIEYKYWVADTDKTTQ